MVTDLRLGWRPEPPDPRTLRMARYTGGALPPPPVKVDWLTLVKHWDGLGNFEVGDCEPAGCAHYEQAMLAANGVEFYPTTADVLAAYSGISGYDPAQTGPDRNNPTDRGCTSRGTLGYWRAHGICGHRITAYVQVNHRDHNEVKTATALFGGLLFAADMPIDADAQFRRRQTWRPTAGPNGRPGSWGGHALYLGAYTSRTLRCVTWGRVQSLGWAWWDTYVSEAYVVVSADWLNKQGTSPSGLNLDALLTDLRAVTA